MSRWLITGCSTGIGREIARAALDAGHQVVVAARRVEPWRTSDAHPGHRGRGRPRRHGQGPDRERGRHGGRRLRWRRRPRQQRGYGYLSAVEEGDDAEVRALFDTNYFGTVDMTKAVLPGMRAQGSGHVVNISSMTGLVANPPNAYYSSTKFAMEAVSEALSKEVAPLGIKVTLIEPGAFRTDWAKRSMHESTTPIDDYAADVGARKELIRAFADHLPGDPRRSPMRC